MLVVKPVAQLMKAKKMTRALMFQGTGSDVGKTVLVAGLCRAAKRRGIKVAPFKPQNMSNNAAVAKADDGFGEIGRGQWLQALACGIEPHVNMNPILLKPQSEVGSQVVVQGKVKGNYKAQEYYALKNEMLKHAMESFEALSSQVDLVLVEGAGSPAEINLREHDIANMGFAVSANVPVVLIGDIDRGGVIASLVGTHTILQQEDRAMIKGFIINKFRGDLSLFDRGIEQIKHYTHWPSFGVLPWFEGVRQLPAEDSVWLDRLGANVDDGFNIVVPSMGKVANFDDLDPLRAMQNVNVNFIRKGDAFPQNADMVILPGSKSTISDLQELRDNGWEEPIKTFAKKGGLVIGICGGYQMLGKIIHDPQGIEGDVKAIDGLGLLDVETQLMGEKLVQNTVTRSVQYDVALEGYEIHIGETSGSDCVRPMVAFDGRADGAINADGNVQGCYLHGLFGSDVYREKLFAKFGIGAGQAPYRESVEEALDALAEHMEQHLDVDGLLGIVMPSKKS